MRNELLNYLNQTKQNKPSWRGECDKLRQPWRYPLPISRLGEKPTTNAVDRDCPALSPGGG